MTTTQQILQFAPIIIALGGLFLAFYIFTKKKSKETLVCPLNSNCDAVINSQYSTFLGIPLEIIGVFYFSFIFLFFLVSFFVVGFNSGYFAFVPPIVTLTAFLFSIYLVMVQLILIKQWCLWCLVSTFLCAMEFIFILILSPLNIKALLSAIFNI